MNVICSNMHGSRGDHIKSSKSDRERQIWHHLYVKSKKKKWYKWAIELLF